MTAPESPRHNLLLGSLSVGTYKRLFPHLELVETNYGQVIYECGRVPNYVYFPTTCVVSKVNLIEDGTSSELALVGNEGFVGLGLLTGGGTMTHQAMVSRGGFSYRLRRQLFIHEFDHRSGHCNDPVFLQLLLRYVQAMITQIAQTAACNRHHSIYQQLSRWLLVNLDRQSSEELIVTQDHIASMLGVRRESVTEAAGKLQQKGLITYSRGHIRVLSRPGLESQVCECYNVVKTEYDRLLPIPADMAA
ncbi:Crp/Fnr family transcriptional regulator [Methylomonas methanica]|uniref:Crp/Fnr family transcriptional regulator n=1 Tax=Methylomonas methanica TaxID=421 RepID=A0A177LSA3_METMH|nr:Crp/Fnr family transcriptional regulator [Methylomonas methanica]OAH96377.1 Crp/Fnr family transcriptional regulator [Methylomonas methanica]